MHSPHTLAHIFLILHQFHGLRAASSAPSFSSVHSGVQLHPSVRWVLADDPSGTGLYFDRRVGFTCARSAAGSVGLRHARASALTRCCSYVGDGLFEATWMRQFYQQFIYPKLQPHQRVWVVPGLTGPLQDGIAPPGPPYLNDTLFLQKIQARAAALRACAVFTV